ncbi:MAG: hypothetical protein ACYC6G_12085 [Desulfobaccales bacterium]
MDICIDAPEAHLLGLKQRPHSACHSHIPASHPPDRHCSTPGVVPALLPRPESLSP